MWVRGIDGGGREVVHLHLPHGVSPEAALRDRGYQPVDADSVAGRRDPHELTVTYRVEPDAVGTQHGIPEPVGPPRDPDLVLAPGERAVQVQRVAAYAVVRSTRGVLLTEYSDRTNAPGRWGLPGGGLDPGELPEEALHRELAEETGQPVQGLAFLGCLDSRWVGRAPNGRLEDYHAVRLLYAALCADPSEPVVHDVGGTTESAMWVPVHRVLDAPLTAVWRAVLDEVVAAWS
jgi:8-oxo-dGTP pyrophosphatase MutT (NUDIX family)